MADSFVITGTRPPSAAGARPGLASSKDFGYYTKKPHSAVDETLFQSHHSSSLHTPVTFAAPWEKKIKGKDDLKKKPKPGRPLLWAPPTTTSHLSDKNNNSMTSPKSITDDGSVITSKSIGTIQGVPLKHQYHRLKHTPTFVDETLFGHPLLEPSFKAPWEEKRKVKQVHNWFPEQLEGKPVRRRRPATALGLRGYSVSSNAVPIWKP